MRNSEKKKQIVLIVAIVLVVVSGIIVFQRTGKSRDVNIKEDRQYSGETVETTRNYEQSQERLYYIEESRGEEVFENIRHVWIMKYNDKPVRLSKNPESHKMSLMDMETGEYIYEFPNEEMYDYDGLWIDEENIFWTIKYDKDLKQTIVKSFNEDGQEVNPPIILENFMGAEGFDEVEAAEELYLDIRNMRTDSENLYFSGHAIKMNDESFFQAYTKDGTLLKTFIGCNKGLELDKEGNLLLGTEGKTYFTEDDSGEPDLYATCYIKFDGNTFEKIYHTYTDTIGDISYNQSKDKVYALFPFKEGKIVAYSGEKGEKLEEIFVFGEDSSYMSSNPTHWIWDFYVGDNEDIYIALRSIDQEEGYGYKFFAYREKTRRNNVERPVTLTVTVAYRDDFLANAIRLYELKYPEEKVEYNYVYNNIREFSSHREEYIEQLAMDILTGEVGDVVATGLVGLVYEDIFRTDAFEDLTPYLKRDSSYEELNKNVLEGIKIDNAIRGLPISFSYYYYEINEELANDLGLGENYEHLKWSDVLKWTKTIEEKAPGSHLLIGKNPVAIALDDLLMANIPDLIDLDKKKADLNQKWFVDLIKEFKSYSKSESFALESPGIHLEYSFHGSLLRYMFDHERGLRDQIKYFCESNISGTKKRYIPVFQGEKSSNRRARSNNMYSINARSDRKESAWKFLSFLLGRDIQQDPRLAGTPLNVIAHQKLINRYKYEFENQYPKELLEKFEKNTMNNSQKIDFLYDENHFIKDIKDPIMEYLSDQITLEEAIKKAQENVDLRLNE